MAPSEATLAPPTRDEVDSPGSSVFDLPTQAAVSTPALRVTIGKETPRTPAPESALPPEDTSPTYLVISGGTGGNAICSAFETPRACYVLPVSDDGGSSSEIIRVLGGPSIGTHSLGPLWAI